MYSHSFSTYVICIMYVWYTHMHTSTTCIEQYVRNKGNNVCGFVTCSSCMCITTVGKVGQEAEEGEGECRHCHFRGARIQRRSLDSICEYYQWKGRNKVSVLHVWLSSLLYVARTRYMLSKLHFISTSPEVSVQTPLYIFQCP